MTAKLTDERNFWSEFRSYFSSTEWIWFSLFIVTGLLLRWYGLDLRPLHHDESIHVMFGRYYFDWPEQNYYKYNPEYHGPLMYTLFRIVYNIFGDTEWSGRFMMAVMGSGWTLLPFVFRRYFKPFTTLVLTGAIALSPTLIYWSRFTREDAFVISGMCMVLYGVFVARSPLKSFWVLLGILFQFASKENSYVTGALILGYYFFEYFFNLLIHKRREPFPFFFIFVPLFALSVFLHVMVDAAGGTYLSTGGIDPINIALAIGVILFVVDYSSGRWSAVPAEYTGEVTMLARFLTREWRSFLISFLFVSFLFCYLFSAGFRYPDGILDGLYRKGIAFWLDKHNVERIKGPFLFHFYELSWYEFLFMCALLVQTYLFYVSGGLLRRMLGGSILFLGILCFLGGSSGTYAVVGNPIWDKFKAKDALDVLGVVLLLFHPIVVTCTHLYRKERKLAFFGYLFTASFFTYSYLGEKVPWLSTYPFIAGLIYLALYFQDYVEEHQPKISEIVSYEQVILFLGYLLLILGLIFCLEDKVEGNVHLLYVGLAFVAIGFCDHRWSFLGSFRTRPVLLAALFLLNLRFAIMTNFDFRWRELGYISQVHTTREVVEIARRVRKDIETQEGGTRRTVLVEGDAVWPLTWYLRDLPEYKFKAEGNERWNFDYIFQDFKEDAKDIPESYNVSKIALRGWWVPDFTQMTFKKFLNYCINQRTWSGLGYTYVHFLTKKR